MNISPTFLSVDLDEDSYILVHILCQHNEGGGKERNRPLMIFKDSRRCIGTKSCLRLGSGLGNEVS